MLEGTARCTSTTLRFELTLRVGDSFGESVLVGEKCRRASVTALEQCRLLQISMESVYEAQIDLTALATR